MIIIAIEIESSSTNPVRCTLLTPHATLYADLFNVHIRTEWYLVGMLNTTKMMNICQYAPRVQNACVLTHK